MKRIVQTAIGCYCGKCLKNVSPGAFIWYEGGLSNVDGCEECDADCKAASTNGRQPDKHG